MLKLTKRKRRPLLDSTQEEEDESPPIVQRVKEAGKEDVVDAKAFVAAVYAREPEKVAANIILQIGHMSSCVQDLWKKYLVLAGHAQKTLFAPLYLSHVREQKDGFKRFFVRNASGHPASIEDWARAGNMAKAHQEKADALRAALAFEGFDSVSVCHAPDKDGCVGAGRVGVRKCGRHSGGL